MKFFKPFASLATPAGAAIAAICFFLPWIEASCGPVTVRANGARIGGIFWLVLTAAVLIMVSCLVLQRRGKLLWLRNITLGCSACALIIILYKFFDTFFSGKVNLNISDAGSVLRFGAFGTIFGFLLAVLGAVYLDSGRASNVPQSDKSDSRPSP